ncbi:MBL fold metallo-hydrolase [Schaedlerella arabinosiphila]|uniref:MBL fold metallo-hydrolase n=1 Tax=Schaedlerella arabinosiphila TaxID=2044587 RepID=A0A9X5C618_9FIRM|nr:MBL fold metallo-hydrolase [Schaedlerella arabinosiphila]KAI4443453.1 hypothetical protein C824_005988 [Schaedlerella arabinosiphila]NDO68233.1 MBL fold metallo-hydrolase [Schaedlerella arabinosiphila]
MKIINLMEDTTGKNDVYAEHGFSVYIETPGHRLLVDTGASEKTWENAARLGVDLNCIDLVFLSHGHYDHSGGILSFAERNQDAKIYMHARALHDYYNLKDGREKYIGIDQRIPKLPQVVLLEDGCRIDREISVFSGVTGRRKWPKSNLALKRKTEEGFRQDSFDHEQYIVAEAEGKKVLVSGCAHNGILNILDRFRELYGGDPDVVISGFHMMKQTGYEADERELIRDAAKELRGMGTRFYTGHCTGTAAFQMMREIMGEQLGYMHSGDQILL